MPQLDIGSYFSQTTWSFLFLVLLYYVLAKTYLPRIAQTFAARNLEITKSHSFTSPNLLVLVEQAKGVKDVTLNVNRGLERLNLVDRALVDEIIIAKLKENGRFTLKPSKLKPLRGHKPFFSFRKKTKKQRKKLQKLKKKCRLKVKGYSKSSKKQSAASKKSYKVAMTAGSKKINTNF
jgi:hypothetical protein